MNGSGHSTIMRGGPTGGAGPVSGDSSANRSRHMVANFKAPLQNHVTMELDSISTSGSGLLQAGATSGSESGGGLEGEHRDSNGADHTPAQARD